MSKLENEITEIIRNYDFHVNSETSKYIRATKKFDSLLKEGIVSHRGNQTASITKRTHTHIKFNA